MGLCHSVLVWREQRPIGCLNLQVIFRKSVINHRALGQKITHKDEASYGSPRRFPDWNVARMMCVWKGAVCECERLCQIYGIIHVYRCRVQKRYVCLMVSCMCLKVLYICSIIYTGVVYKGSWLIQAVIHFTDYTRCHASAERDQQKETKRKRHINVKRDLYTESTCSLANLRSVTFARNVYGKRDSHKATYTKRPTKRDRSL